MAIYPLDPGELAWPLPDWADAVQPAPQSVRLNGIEYLIDRTKYRRASIDATREGVTNQADPNEGLFDHEGTWWRHQLDFSSGAGQSRFDFDEDSDQNRYLTSSGVDPWTPHQITITHTLGQIVANPGVSPMMFAKAANAAGVEQLFLAHVSGSLSVTRTPDLSSFTVMGGATGTPADIASDGFTVYLATSTGIYTYNAAAFAMVSSIGDGSGSWTAIDFCAGRLLAAKSNVLYTVGVSSITAIYTHYSASAKIHSMFAVGSKIYACVTNGNRSEIITFVANDVGTLIFGQEASSFPPGERINTVISHAGVVIIGTTKGVRISTPGGDGTLVYGSPINGTITEPAQESTSLAAGGVTGLGADGNYVYFSGLNYLSSSGTITGPTISRLDLSNFTDVLTPAWAPDTYVTGATTTIGDVARLGTQTVFVIQAATTSLYASHLTNYLSGGSLQTGRVYFGTIEQKRLTAIYVRHSTLITGQSIRVDVYDERGVIQLAEVNNTVGSNSFMAITDFPDEALSSYFLVRVSMFGPNSSTPAVYHWTLRAFPVTRVAQRFVLPLMLASNVVVGGTQVSLATDTEIERLVTLWAAKNVVDLRVGDTTYRVRIDKFEQQPTSWDDHQLNSLFLVEAITV